MPTILSAVRTRVESRQYLLRLCDTASMTRQEKCDPLRPFSYPVTVVFLICCSLDSFHNAKEEWAPELREYTLNVPHLIGTQTDLHGDPKALARLNNMKEKPVCVKEG